MRPSTVAVQSYYPLPSPAGDVVPPLHLTTTFDQRNQQISGYYYGRTDNPTRQALEGSLSALEGRGQALTYSSGQAATAAVIGACARYRDRIVVGNDLYGGTFRLFEQHRASGLQVDYVDFAVEPQHLARVIGEQACLIWVETPTNPTLRVYDVAQVCEIGHQVGAVVAVDNTFSTALIQRPLDLGADISAYSTTKYIAGHSDSVGGALVTDNDVLYRQLVDERGLNGTALNPFDCYLTQRGLATLPLRVEQQAKTAAYLADQLKNHPAVTEVIYPTQSSHPQFEVAGKQMASGGAIVSLRLRTAAMPVLSRLKLFSLAVSLGSVHSLAEVPAQMTHRPIPPLERERLGIDDRLVRLAVGIEDRDDLLDDLLRGLDDS